MQWERIVDTEHTGQTHTFCEELIAGALQLVVPLSQSLLQSGACECVHVMCVVLCVRIHMCVPVKVDLQPVWNYARISVVRGIQERGRQRG